MVRKLFVAALSFAFVAVAIPALAAGDLTDQQVFNLVGPKTCSDGGFFDFETRSVGIPIITLDPGHYYEYCFRLKKLKKKDIGVKTNGLVEMQTVNLGNAQCGTASAFLIRPNRKPLIGPVGAFPRTWADIDSSAPQGISYYTPGVWRVIIHYEEGCDKYALTVSW